MLINLESEPPSRISEAGPVGEPLDTERSQESQGNDPQDPRFQSIQRLSSSLAPVR